MKQTVTFQDFCNNFRDHDRVNQYSYNGKRALFDYLEEYEQETGAEIELDVIALSCDYAEYSNLAEVLAEYDDITSREELDDNTTVIDVDGGGLIIQAF